MTISGAFAATGAVFAASVLAVDVRPAARRRLLGAAMVLVALAAACEIAAAWWAALA